MRHVRVYLKDVACLSIALDVYFIIRVQVKKVYEALLFRLICVRF